MRILHLALAVAMVVLAGRAQAGTPGTLVITQEAVDTSQKDFEKTLKKAAIKQLAKSGVLIIGPNATFLDYIGQVLPSLGETGVLLSTIGDLYPGVKATREDSLRAGEIKGSLDILEVLKQAVRDRQEVPAEPIRLSFDGYPVTLDRKIATKARGRARSSRRPHNLAKPIFTSSVIDALTEQLAETMGADLSGGPSLLSRTDIAEIRDEMRGDQEIQQAIGKLWPLLSPQEVLADLLADPKRLERAGNALDAADRAELVRPDNGEFSAADAPLLDELAELLGVDDAEERERSRRRWRAQLAEAQDALDILTGSAPQDLEDELDPEILMAYDLIDASQLAERQDVRTRQTTAERAAGDRTWTYAELTDRTRRFANALVALDTTREWYRYHHLFGELLRNELVLTHPDRESDVRAAAAQWSPESLLRRLEAVLACRTALDVNVKPEIAVEAMMTAMHQG